MRAVRFHHGWCSRSSLYRRPAGACAAAFRFVTVHATSKQCPFEALGLTPNASREEVKARYKSRAKTAHPDGGGSEAEFKRVGEAYSQCLKYLDEQEVNRKAYEAEHGQQHGSTKHSEAAQKAARAANALNDLERRARLLRLFPTLKNPHEIDEVLDHCLRSGLFADVHVGEPLLRAIDQYPRTMPLGEENVKRCFTAINSWEHWNRKLAPQHYYHPLLVLYCEPETSLTTSITDLTVGVSLILDELKSKGHEPDDWSLTLADRVFRYYPHSSIY